MSMVINLRQLEYFLAVAERENISAAARALHVTQPMLSRQIKIFEEDLGWSLIERSSKSIHLTREGLIVQKEGKRILREVSSSLMRMKDEIEGPELRVGFAPSLAEGLIDRGLARFTKKHPRVRVRWSDCSTQEMWAKLESDELDFILEVANDQAGISWHTLKKRALKVMVPINHPLAKRRWLKPSDLDGERLLLLSRHEYPGYWQQVTDYFSEHRANAKIAGEFDGIASLRMGVEAEMGIAFVSDGTNLSSRVKLLSLKPNPNPLCVALGHREGRGLAQWEEDFLGLLIGENLESEK